MLASGKHASVQMFLIVFQASISKFVYLTNRIKFVSENTENLFFVLFYVKYKFKWFNKL